MAMEREDTLVEKANTKAEREDTRETETEKEKEKAKDTAHQGRARMEDQGSCALKSPYRYRF